MPSCLMLQKAGWTPVFGDFCDPNVTLSFLPMKRAPWIYDQPDVFIVNPRDQIFFLGTMSITKVNKTIHPVLFFSAPLISLHIISGCVAFDAR